MYGRTLLLLLSTAFVAQPIAAQSSIQVVGAATSHIQGNCDVPPADTSFTTTDSIVWINFTYTGGTAGDQGFIDWFDPAGNLYTTYSFQQNSSGGGYCYEYAISIAGFYPASKPGNWRVRLRWNSTEVFSRNFTISGTVQVSIQVTNGVTAHSVPSGPCSLPPASSHFVTSDDKAWVVFTYNGGLAGDQGFVDWFDPSGSLYLTNNFTQQGSGGGYCYEYFISISGFYPASQPGTWRVRLRWNSTEVFSRNFTISAPIVLTNNLALPQAIAGSGYSYTLQTSGGTPPFVWSVTGLPAGLTVSQAGVISGVTNAIGFYQLTVSVQDSGGNSAIGNATLAVGVRPPSASFSSFPTTAYPMGITSGPDGALWFTEASRNVCDSSQDASNVTVTINPSTSIVVTGTLPPGLTLLSCAVGTDSIGRISTSGVVTEYPLKTLGAGPFAITKGPDGALWFTENQAGQIGRITTDGRITEYALPNQKSGPEGIVSGPDGALWFTENSIDKIGRITTGGVITEYSLPSSITQPEGIAVGPDLALWFTGGGGKSIGSITTAGGISTYSVPFGSCGPGLSVVSSSSDASNVTIVVTIVNDSSDPASSLNTTFHGIVSGPDGALWFRSDCRIGRITTAGSTLMYYIPAAAASFSLSSGDIAVGPDGALWFTETGNVGRITVGGAVTEYPIVPTSSDSPFGVTTGPDGAVWYTDTNSSRVGRVGISSGNVTVTTSPAGLPVIVDGIIYNGSPSFSWIPGTPHTIAVASSQTIDGSSRYAFNSWSDGGASSHSVTAVAGNTTYTAKFGIQYILTMSVAPSASGAITINPPSGDGYYNAGTIVQVTASPNTGFQFSNWSSDLSDTPNPQSITMNSPHRVQANFKGPSKNAAFSEYPTAQSSYPTGLTAGPDGAIWFTEQGANKIARISTVGKIREFPLPLNFSNPGGIALGSDGALWFTESGRIGRMTTAGVEQDFPLPSPTSPVSIAAGPDGALWFTEYNADKIGRIATNGSISEYKLTTGSSPQAIAAGPDGALWFTETNANKVGRITIAGGITEFVIPTAVSSPQGIATGPDGALWFVEQGVSKVGRVTAAGAITEFGVAPFTNLLGIAAGADGALWFTDEFTSRVGRITTAGAVTIYQVPAASSSGFGSIVAGPDGALWFSESTGIQRAVPPSVTTCAVSLPQSSAAFTSAGGIGSVTVRAPAGAAGGCSWTAVSSASWVSITDAGGGTGNGTVNYAVKANSSSSARTATLIIANQAFNINQAGNSVVTCVGSVPSPPNVAIEGRTELLGDYLLTCTGLTASATVDFTLTLNTNVTNQLINGGPDATLSVNGGPLLSGQLAAYNAIRWAGVPLASAGGSATVRISRVRADGTALLTQRIVADPGNPQPVAITWQLTIAGPGTISVSSGLQTMARAAQSVVFTPGAPFPPGGGPQTSMAVLFKEAQNASFQANFTRLRMSISKLPTTAQVYAPVYPLEGTTQAQLYSADATGAGGSPIAGSPFAGGVYQQLPNNGASITATWLVLAADSTKIESWTFPLLILNASASDLSGMQVAGGFGPVSDISTASATAPVPRYRDFSVQPKLGNLRLTSTVQVQPAGQGNTSTPRAPGPNAGASGLYALFSHQAVNDTYDPSQTMNNVMIRDNLPTGLTMVSCALSTGGSCTQIGNQVLGALGTLGPQQAGTMTIGAAVDASLTGTIENPASAAGDSTNLDLLATTSSTSFLILGGTPVAVAGSPAAGTGGSQSFSFQFSHPNGYQNLGVANVLINSALDGRKACYLAYVVPATTLVLVNDAGDAGGSYAGSIPLGSQSTISNSQCAVGLVSALGSGTTLTLTLNIAFKPSFGGNKVAYVAARDQGSGSSNWQALAVWQVPSTQGQIAVAAVTPARVAAPAGTPVQVTLTYSDSKGSGDLGVLNILVNNAIDGRKACYLAFVPSTNSLILIDDAGDAGGPYAGQMPLNGTNGGIQNGQCLVNGSGSSVTPIANGVTLTLNMTMLGAFGGNQIIYAAARDRADGNNTGWQSVGTWTVQ